MFVLFNFLFLGWILSLFSLFYELLYEFFFFLFQVQKPILKICSISKIKKDLIRYLNWVTFTINKYVSNPLSVRLKFRVCFCLFTWMRFLVRPRYILSTCSCIGYLFVKVRVVIRVLSVLFKSLYMFPPCTFSQSHFLTYVVKSCPLRVDLLLII